jgi:hypothetical protein
MLLLYLDLVIHLFPSIARFPQEREDDLGAHWQGLSREVAAVNSEPRINRRLVVSTLPAMDLCSHVTPTMQREAARAMDVLLRP